MKKFLSRFLPLTMAGVMLLSSVPAFALRSEAYGEQLTVVSTRLHQNTELTTETYWSDYYKDLRTENYITYTPGEDVTMMAYTGDTVTNKTTALDAANALAKEGYRVVAGINGDFFDGNGTPTGILVSGGRLLSSDGGNNALGFKADGSAVIGTPALAIRGSLNGQGSAYIAGLNKARNSYGGIYAYTYDFNAAHTTGTVEAGVDVVMEPASAQDVLTLLGVEAAEAMAEQPTVGGTVYYRVVEVIERTTGVTALQEDQFVLSANANAAAEELDYLRSMQAGDLFGLSVAANDPAWSEVTEAVGGLYLLVKDGVAQSNFQASNAPRTAVGVKENGDIVLYTVDGRRTGHSIGSSLATLAQRLVELGCVSAICLDGGGSTTAVATMPDSLNPSVQNIPSDGADRKVSSLLFLVADDQASRSASHVYLASESQHIMAGSSMTVRSSLVDTNYIPMASRVSLSASAGTISGNTFTAPQTGGEVTITGTASGKRGELTVNVVETPDELQLTVGGTYTNGLSVLPGGKVDLDAAAIYQHLTLATEDSDFTWTVTGNIGTIDENGVFTASNIPGATGGITLSKGSASVTIPVTMSSMPLVTLEDFENAGADDYSGFGITTALDTATVRYGKQALKVGYDFTGGTGAAIRLALKPADGYDRLTFSVYGDGSGNTISLYDDEGDATHLVTLDFTGWKQVSVPLPEDCKTIEALIISGNMPTGTLYFDQFVSSYGGVIDNEAPVVGSEDLHNGNLQVTVWDVVDGDLPRSSVVLTCDGEPVSLALHGGVYSADLSSLLADGKAHLIALTAWDASGNRVRKTWDVAATNGQPSPFVDNLNADGTPHWAASYLDRLYEQGVLTGEEEGGQRYVRPNRNMTRMEFAVMLSRWLELDLTDYTDVKLPFVDQAQIHDWALPAAKAMYALGIMQGNQELDGLHFAPGSTVTRAQAITMLGRLQEKGYAADDLSAFSDSADVPSWALPYVQTMVAQGILSGSDGKLSPNAAMTRAQACKILYMMQ